MTRVIQILISLCIASSAMAQDNTNYHLPDLSHFTGVYHMRIDGVDYELEVEQPERSSLALTWLTAPPSVGGKEVPEVFDYQTVIDDWRHTVSIKHEELFNYSKSFTVRTGPDKGRQVIKRATARHYVTLIRRPDNILQVKVHIKNGTRYSFGRGYDSVRVWFTYASHSFYLKKQ